jgi:hypothetical protein
VIAWSPRACAAVAALLSFLLFGYLAPAVHAYHLKTANGKWVHIHTNYFGVYIARANSCDLMPPGWPKRAGRRS